MSLKQVLYVGDPPKPEFIYKYCVFILTCLNFSHLQSTLHLMQYTYQDVFSTASNSFWTHRFWCLLVLLPFFVSLLPHQENVSLWGVFFIQGNKKCYSGWDWVNREGRTRESCRFKSKTAEHSVWCGKCACKSPIMKWANMLKESSKKLTEA